MAIRRSARLRSTLTPEAQEPSPRPDTAPKLSSVEEQDETPGNPPAHTPTAKKGAQRTPSTRKHQKVAETTTPTSNSVFRPSLQEMHPSKAHQSTTKQADSGLILGFNPIKKDADGNVVKDDMMESTPSKSKASPAPTQFGTPGYEFKFGQDAQLSDEAKLLMDSVRGDVARIRAKMIMDKSAQGEKDREAEQHGDRKIAKPKGKSGRFSDVHMAEFKKMDSIAAHPSLFRAGSNRLQPGTKSLKRTKSKAQLDEPETHGSSSSRPQAKTSALPAPVTATKRVKHREADDASTARNDSEKPDVDNNTASRNPTVPRPRPRSTVRSSLMTPTRASMARSTSTSIRAPKTSLIPSLVQSPSAKTVASPRTPRTDFNPRLKGNLPTFNNLRSILRRRQPLFSRDPSKIAAGTHVAAPDFNPDTLLASQAELTDSAPTPSPKKHVEFTPSVKSRYELAQASPSRSKIPTTPTCSNVSNIAYPTLPSLTPEQNHASNETTDADLTKSPTIRHVRKPDAPEQAAPYPELPVVVHGIAHGIGNKKRHRHEVEDGGLPNTEDSENVPPADDQPEERSTKRLKANPPTPSPVKSRPIKTPVRNASSRMGTPASASAKRRGILSLSRLNMLAKPKGRA
ncbi:hypothetical protein N7492_001137 [Penicillium capsulatum]|uniref:Erythromycin esterase n=1 Tax=Penicillium capsulatum TaxID=69766 RepID=A0A9W9LZ56_9EURO|nr:hypothetical protein N7492_001137 [Penicillium capsulatum]KAJ6129807.1 hypothetical protein N7512_002587 [Penicillium capsulatum]